MNTRTTTLVTHLDSKSKKLYLKWLVKNGVVPIFISKQTAKIFIDNLNYACEYLVLPLPPQLTDFKRKIKVGFFSNIYPDGRKREDVILESIAKVKSRESFEFYIMGESTEEMCLKLSEFGCKVNHLNSFNNEIYQQYLSLVDYTLYSGFDEVAVSVLDSVSAGIPVMVPPIGGNLELQGRNIVFFRDKYELISILEKIVDTKYEGSDKMKMKNYDEYVSKLIIFWSKMSRVD